jgi:hypothetical protein
MPTQTIKARLKFARKTTAEWEVETRILLAGEPAIEVLEDGTEKEKRGDGVSLWADLPYVSGGGGGGGGESGQIGSPTFIQSTQPTTGELGGQDQYLWWDTSGGNLTLWIEDGEP